uniref:Transmembrane protein n=1 Tax=Steinernema glaseri TaxID=37863 RepID=A0A1I8AHS0_9BILA
MVTMENQIAALEKLIDFGSKEVAEQAKVIKRFKNMWSVEDAEEEITSPEEENAVADDLEQTKEGTEPSEEADEPEAAHLEATLSSARTFEEGVMYSKVDIWTCVYMFPVVLYLLGAVKEILLFHLSLGDIPRILFKAALVYGTVLSIFGEPNCEGQAKPSEQLPGAEEVPDDSSDEM